MKLRQSITSILLILLFKGLSLNLGAQELMTGDLIFQASSDGNFSKAIAKSTAEHDSLKIVHVGIIEIDEGSGIYVIDASPSQGVRRIPYSSFINSSDSLPGKSNTIIKRLTIDFPREETINRAKSYIGRNYDWLFLPDNEEIYCSELIYNSYLDYDGQKIFEAIPMNFRDSDGNMPQFWIDLYKKNGIEIPEGLPGTNPNDLSKDPRLITVE